MDQARQRLKLQARTRQEKYNPRHILPHTTTLTKQQLTSTIPPPATTPTTHSAWTTATLPNSDQKSATNCRLAKLEAFTVQLGRQGCKIPPVVAQLPPPSPTVMTPYKPPKSSQDVTAEDRDTGNTSSQEMEEYAMEIMDQMDM